MLDCYKDYNEILISKAWCTLPCIWPFWRHLTSGTHFKYEHTSMSSTHLQLPYRSSPQSHKRPRFLLASLCPRGRYHSAILSGGEHLHTLAVSEYHVRQPHLPCAGALAGGERDGRRERAGEARWTSWNPEGRSMHCHFFLLRQMDVWDWN